MNLLRKIYRFLMRTSAGRRAGSLWLWLTRNGRKIGQMAEALGDDPTDAEIQEIIDKLDVPQRPRDIPTGGSGGGAPGGGTTPEGTVPSGVQSAESISLTSPEYRDRNSPVFSPYGSDDDFVEPLHPDQYSEEIFVPDSTNVFSFMYDFFNNDLYVTYRVIEKVAQSSAWDTVGGDQRPNARGQTYQYSKVPERVFLGMKIAASKGKFVWDQLRQRGSFYGTQYQYSLVSPQRNADGSMYVSRRATRKGFSGRAVVIGGRKGAPEFVKNTLPTQQFSTRRRNR